MIETRIKHDFNHHPPSSPAIAEAHEALRFILQQTALSIVDIVPSGREQSLALTKLEEAMFWANAGLARAQRVGNHKPQLDDLEGTPEPFIQPENEHIGTREA